MYDQGYRDEMDAYSSPYTESDIILGEVDMIR